MSKLVTGSVHVQASLYSSRPSSSHFFFNRWIRVLIPGVIFVHWCRVDEVNALKGLLEEELRSAHEGKQVNITKTALMKLKVNVLRGMLETVGGDTRGNKAAIVDRILGAIKEDFEQEKMQEVADYVGEGLIQRRKIFRLMRLKEKAQGKYNQPVSQEELETSLAEAASPNNIYSKAFSSPHEVAKLLVDARADDVVIIDVTGDRCSFTDYMVVASASSHQLVHMMASAVLYELKQRCKEVAPGVYPTIEGVDDPNPNWLVIDAGSIVVHVFHEDARSEYDLEGLWGRSDTVTRVAATVSTHNLNTLRM